jgi:hypothetical protein
MHWHWHLLDHGQTELKRKQEFQAGFPQRWQRNNLSWNKPFQFFWKREGNPRILVIVGSGSPSITSSISSLSG